MRGSITVVFLLGAFVGLLVACSGSEPSVPVKERRASVGPRALLEVAPAQLPEFVRARYRLAPDRRFLGALEVVDALGRGGEGRSAEARYEGGEWRVSLGEDDVGTLPELPRFEQATALLVGWVERAGLRAGEDPGIAEVEAAAGAADPGAVLAALAAVEEGRAGDGLAVRSAATGYAWLAWMTVDRLDLADPLLARAWAWAAIERALLGAEAPANQALVARALGYEVEAASLAAELAEGDPTRAYLRDEPATDCEEPARRRACDLLQLARLVERGRRTEAREILQSGPFGREPTPPAAALAIELAEFGEAHGSGILLGQLALQDLDPERRRSGDDSWSEAGPRTRAFEAALARVAPERARGLVPAGVLESYYRAAFYAGLHAEAEFLVDSLSSGPAAAELAAGLEGASPVADELARWLRVEGAALDGSLDPAPAIELLRDAGILGGAVLSWTQGTITRQAGSTDPERRRAVPDLFKRLDTRPAHRLAAARTAKGALTSLGLYEKLARSAVAAAPYACRELPALVARMDLDRERLREIAGDRGMALYARIVALDALASLGEGDDAFLRAAYEELAADPDGATEPLLTFLEERGELAEALAAVEAAERGLNETLSLRPAALATRRAGLLAAMGRLEEAWDAIQPGLASYRQESLLEGARIALAREDSRRALELARAAQERYPTGGEGAAVAVRALWQLGDLDGAAREAAGTEGLTTLWNRYLPEAFEASFADRPAEDAAAAFAAFQEAGLPAHTLGDIAVKWGGLGAVDEAVRVLGGLRHPDPGWNTKVRIDAYELLRAERGPEAAREWLRSVVPQPSQQLAATLFQLRAYELLLDLFPPEAKVASTPEVRLMQLASLLHQAREGDAAWLALVQGIPERAEGDVFFARAVRVLAGLEPGSTLFELADTLAELTTLGWVMGVRAAADGNFEEADSWFQVALESEQKRQPPHAWSFVIESDWIQSGDSITALEATHRF